MLETALDIFVHLLVVLAAPPLLVGVINKTKAFFAGRQGPVLLQAYYDIAKQLRKGSVFSRTTTWVFRAGPVVGVASVVAASLLVPFGAHQAPVAFSGDLILFAYLLALGRFFTAVAALDTGSAFEGMGAAREVSFSALAEPALFFGMLVMAKLSGQFSLSLMLASPWSAGWMTAGASLVLVAAGWLVVLLVENSRIPVDDPNTHLELTMIHEVMVLDHSGPAFGLILYSAATKLFVLGALLTRIIFPFSTGNSWANWGIFLGSMLLLGVVVGTIESTLARLRLLRVPQLLITACLLSAFGMILLLR